MTDILNDEELNAPGKPDFRRVGRWKSPQVVMPDGKRSTYGRFSNAGKLLDDESNLTDWKLCTTVWGAAFRPELMAQASTLHIKADRNELRDIAEECLASGKGKERTVKGVAVHSMFDHIDLKDGWEPAPQWEGLCNSYEATLDSWGLVPADIEVNCVHHGFRLAGRMDRRYRTTKVLVAPDNTTIPIGSMIAADTKTGAVLEYAAGSYATQLAGYAHADFYDVTTDETIPFDPPTFQDWGLVVHADSGGTEVQMYWVDLNAGMEGLKLSQAIKGWRQRADLLTLGAGPVLPPAAEVPAEPPVEPSDGSRTLSLLQHTRDRVLAVLAHSELAGKELARVWPEGIPGLKKGGHTWDQLQDILDVVMLVEAHHSVPFFPAWADPEAPDVTRHPSYSDKWAKPDGSDKAPTHAREAIRDAINGHPRKELLRQWAAMAVEGGLDATKDTFALTHALIEFASIAPAEDWPDDDVSTMLEGTLRALGYENGLKDLGRINPDDAPKIMSAVFSITAGTAVLLYRQDGKPIVRTNIVKGK